MQILIVVVQFESPASSEVNKCIKVDVSSPFTHHSDFIYQTKLYQCLTLYSSDKKCCWYEICQNSNVTSRTSTRHIWRGTRCFAGCLAPCTNLRRRSSHPRIMSYISDFLWLHDYENHHKKHGTTRSFKPKHDHAQILINVAQRARSANVVVLAPTRR